MPFFFPESDIIQDEPSRYSLYASSPLSGILMFDILLLEALQDPMRNARYELNAEKCTQIAQLLWLSVLLL